MFWSVNVVRAERCAALSVVKPTLLKKFKPLRGASAAPVTLREMKNKPRMPPLKTITGEVLTNVFVYLRDPASAAPPCGDRPHARSGQIMQVQTRLNDIPTLANAEEVAYIEIAEALKPPRRCSPSCVRRPPTGRAAGSDRRANTNTARTC